MGMTELCGVADRGVVPPGSCEKKWSKENDADERRDGRLGCGSVNTWSSDNSEEAGRAAFPGNASEAAAASGTAAIAGAAPLPCPAPSGSG